MNLTKQEAIRLHREMWRRISELSDEEIEKRRVVSKLKAHVLDEMCLSNIYVRHCCFCCEYNRNSIHNHWDKNTCDSCPIDWRVDNSLPSHFCESIDSSYYKFVEELQKDGCDFDYARQLAKEISELPERS